MVESEPTPGGGILSSLRGTLRLLVTVARNRVELFAVELHEEKYRILETFLLAGTALIMTMMSLVLLTAVVLFLFPERYRIYVAAAFGILYLIAAIFLLMKAKQRLQTPPFSETINQIRKDSECLTPPK